MHSSVGTPPANCVMTHRFASWSYSTTGSPWPLVAHSPPTPDQSEAIATGPKTEFPVVLLKTWKPSFTIWTYWVSPTSPFVSGGAQLQTTPGKSMPSKFSIGPGMFGRGIVRWTAVSRWLTSFLPLVSFGFSDASPRLEGKILGRCMLRSGRVSMFPYECPTIRPGCFAFASGPARTCVPEADDPAASPAPPVAARTIRAANSAESATPIDFLRRSRITESPFPRSAQGSIPCGLAILRGHAPRRQWTGGNNLGLRRA